MNADTLARIRILVFGLAGLTCAAYSLMAVATNTPNPISPWLPGTSGVVAALVMWSSAFSAGRRAAEIAHDELYESE